MSSFLTAKAFIRISKPHTPFNFFYPSSISALPPPSPYYQPSFPPPNQAGGVSSLSPDSHAPTEQSGAVGERKVQTEWRQTKTEEEEGEEGLSQQGREPASSQVYENICSPLAGQHEKEIQPMEPASWLPHRSTIFQPSLLTKALLMPALNSKMTVL